MKTKPSIRKPRNPFVAPALVRHAGRHQRGTGALRRAARQALHRELQKEHPPSP
ncbi:MAG: hypothetical protein HUU30_11280 [Burkholderiaceae bacterium]|jgi:hypothetical protein|nr:hypothetical protein [Aquabacterium sp.]NUP86318.1 hypothetical protein [Burkholderiaceae bacterium]